MRWIILDLGGNDGFMYGILSLSSLQKQSKTKMEILGEDFLGRKSLIYLFI